VQRPPWDRPSQLPRRVSSYLFGDVRVEVHRHLDPRVPEHVLDHLHVHPHPPEPASRRRGGGRDRGGNPASLISRANSSATSAGCSGLPWGSVALLAGTMEHSRNPSAARCASSSPLAHSPSLRGDNRRRPGPDPAAGPPTPHLRMAVADKLRTPAERSPSPLPRTRRRPALTQRPQINLRSDQSREGLEPRRPTMVVPAKCFRLDRADDGDRLRRAWWRPRCSCRRTKSTRPASSQTTISPSNTAEVGAKTPARSASRCRCGRALQARHRDLLSDPPTRTVPASTPRCRQAGRSRPDLRGRRTSSRSRRDSGTGRQLRRRPRRQLNGVR
jgi:hypothetical protein